MTLCEQVEQLVQRIKMDASTCRIRPSLTANSSYSQPRTVVSWSRARTASLGPISHSTASLVVPKRHQTRGLSTLRPRSCPEGTQMATRSLRLISKTRYLRTARRTSRGTRKAVLCSMGHRPTEGTRPTVTMAPEASNPSKSTRVVS